LVRLSSELAAFIDGLFSSGLESGSGVFFFGDFNDDICLFKRLGFLCTEGDVAGLRSLAMTRPNLLCNCIVMRGSLRRGGDDFDAGGAPEEPALEGDVPPDNAEEEEDSDFFGEECRDDVADDNPPRRCDDDAASLAVTTAELKVVEVGADMSVDLSGLCVPLLLDPHELPKNSDPLLGSHSFGT
jgi:hypothetical protein